MTSVADAPVPFGLCRVRRSGARYDSQRYLRRSVTVGAFAECVHRYPMSQRSRDLRSEASASPVSWRISGEMPRCSA